MNACVRTKGESWVHFIEQFYAGVVLQELGKHNEAIAYFDKSINTYPNFSDAKYYKANSLLKTNKPAEADKLFSECISDFNKGYTINEDNALYENYPYQLKKYQIEILQNRKNKKL